MNIAAKKDALLPNEIINPRKLQARDTPTWSLRGQKRDDDIAFSAAALEGAVLWKDVHFDFPAISPSLHAPLTEAKLIKHWPCVRARVLG